MIAIRYPDFPNDTDLVLTIWRDFIADAPVNLDYQNNEAEFASMPGKYARPKGCILLAEADGRVLGSVAFRKVNENICEMKRLFVHPQARGSGLGRRLVGQLVEEARASGYLEMRLDVMEKYTAARKLYQDFGFVPAEPISFNPVPGASFLGIKL
jgi:putative acetyltransferase